ncbi:FAD-binding oxidoreductase [Aquincola sp. J276]|uniref:NAD(P)/FAD-dependent oxidoreductase n=1 Tax=Aquincola sp. J276 TaxID=2898432 RepID=UPI002151BBCE|nr:FAD-dependent oxidoreductase [Aquincola sp. J276]MCR5864196.1 FAD-binding oxidoreductase [Aquincola sp. J276]
MTDLSRQADVIVVGGGLVGTAVAYGLARQKASVLVLDEGDQAFRASRGNFGLVWVQGKGYGFAPYARWTMRSARSWPQLAAELLQETGVDVQLRQPGGYAFCFTDEELEARRARLQSIRDDLGGRPADYPFEMLDTAAVRERVPHIGPEVVGASYTPMDGHANPLKLLRALHAALQQRGVRVVPGSPVQQIGRTADVFTVQAGGQRWQAPRIVLAAGLGNRTLAEQVGLHAPVQPNRGQVLIGERAGHFLDFPTLNVRQTDEGTIQLGDSMEEVGFDDSTTTDVLAAIARRGVRSFPVLAGLKLVRAWGALRVMSPDGFPIYQQSAAQPGAFVTTCHSGVTLAANHALAIAPWVLGGAKPEEINPFEGSRFLDPNYHFSHAH